MKSIFKKISICFMSVALVLAAASCGAKFNTVGITMGNMVNGGEVTAQNESTYYIKDGSIYKTDNPEKEGKLIKEGDMSFINAVGEKLYYYDNEISTICKINSEGDKVVRIAELYCDGFTVSKDNIYASILTGEGGDDLEASDNYSIARMKVTDQKISSSTPKVLIEKARMVGCVGDSIYALKKTDKGEFLYSYDNDGKNERELLKMPEDGKAIADASAIYVMGSVDGVYGLYQYSLGGELENKLADVVKNAKIAKNAFNIYDGFVYYEDCVTAADGSISDSIIKIDVQSKEKKEVMTQAKITEYNLAVSSGGMMVKYRDAGDITTHPQWQFIAEEEK